MKQHPGVLPANVASLAELPPGSRPKALVWTDERVRAWQKDFDTRHAAARTAGGRVSPVDIWISAPRPSPVMVWTPAQTMVFLDAARRHRLHALWRLIATRGLRRGESCGLRRTDTDLHAATATIRWQITQLGWDPVQGAPKSDAGERTVALDADTITDMTRWRQEQDKEKDAAGNAWAGSGFEFTDERGSPLHPAVVTEQFQLIAYLAGLPPIRLHDLRHGAATLLLAAGHDMKVVQETLGLSSITIAADTYTSVLPQLARKSAEDVAALIRPAPQAPATPDRRRAAGTARNPRAKAAPTSPPGREVNAMTSSSRPSLELDRYLACHGFAPHPGNSTWLDRHTRQQIIRILHKPGEETLLICLTPRSACLYEAVFSPGTPDAVIIAAVDAALSPPPPETAGTGPEQAPAQRARTQETGNKKGSGDPR